MGFLFLQKKHSIFGNFRIKLLLKTECTIKPFQFWNIFSSELLAYSISHVHSQHVRAASPRTSNPNCIGVNEYYRYINDSCSLFQVL
jgi:hypothetical protein